MIDLKDSDFHNQELRTRDRTIVLFHAAWCPYCRELMPSYERFSGMAKVRVARADISDYDSPLWDAFSIEAVPTAILFEDGRAVERIDSRMGDGVTAADFMDFVQKTKSI